MKVAIAGKGGVGKTALCVALARRLAADGCRVLAVDCDPNPNLAESFGLESATLDRFAAEGGLEPVPGTLALRREPAVVEAGGVLDPAESCVVLCDGRRSARLAAERIEQACRARGVEPRRVEFLPGEASALAAPLAATLSSDAA